MTNVFFNDNANLIPQNSTFTLGNTTFRYLSLNIFSVLDYAADLVFKEAGSEKMRILTGGNIGMGTSTPSTTLHVKNISGTHPFRIDSETQDNLFL